MATSNRKPRLVLIGGGGHCKVILSILKKLACYEVAGIVDTKQKLGNYVSGIPVKYCDQNLGRIFNEDGITHAIVSLGSVGNSDKRKELFEISKRMGFTLPAIISPDSIVCEDVTIGSGTVVMPGAIINSGSVIGANCIINTGAVIEHDSSIRDHVHVAPGAVLSGGCIIEDLVHIGAGATLIQSVTVGKKSIVGAGSVVIKDIPVNVVVAGVPAVQIKKIGN